MDINNIVDTTIIERQNKFYKTFISEDGKRLAIIEPGYVINFSTLYLWELLDKRITFIELINNIHIKFPKTEINLLRESVKKLMKFLYDRNLVKIDNNCISDTIDYGNNMVPYYDEVDASKNLGFPTITQIDIVTTRKCNFNCRHCFINKQDGFSEYSELDVNQWKQILDKLCKFGLYSVVITGGEPLVYPQLLELLDYINTLNVEIKLLTNGYLIDENFVKRVSKYKNFSIQVSLDGSSSDTNNLQRNKNDAFDKTMQGIKLLHTYGVSTIVAMVLNKKNINDIYDESIFKVMDDTGIDALAITPSIIDTGNAKEYEKYFISPKEILDLISFLNQYNLRYKLPYFLIISAPPALVEENSLSINKKIRPRCRRGINSFSIRPNGDVCVCSDFMELNYKNYELGNIFKHDLRTIFLKLSEVQREKMESIYKIQGVCSICKELPYCGGACRADAYAKYGNIYAPYSVCQSIYDNGLFPKDKINKDLAYKEFKKGVELPC